MDKPINPLRLASMVGGPDERGADTIRLLKRIQEAIKRLPPKTPVEIASADAVVLSLFWRAVRIFDAIVILLEQQLPEEAFILARSLFTDALRLAELAAAEKSRAELLLGYINSSIDEKMNLVREAQRLGFDTEPETVVKALEQQRRELEDYQRRHGVGRLRNFLSERAAAERFGRGQDYWGYCFAHEFVHGSDPALSYNRSKVGDAVGIHARTNDQDLIQSFGWFAGESVVQAGTATAKIFGWNSYELMTMDHELKRITQSFR